MTLRKGTVAIGQELNSSKPHAFPFAPLDHICPRQEQARRPSKPENCALNPKSNTDLKAIGRGLIHKDTPEN